MDIFHMKWRRLGVGLAVASLTGFVAMSTPAGATAKVAVPAGLGVKSFNSSFSTMSQLKGLVKAGSGLVGVILPDTTSSTRYVNFDAPYLAKAFRLAGHKT